MAADLRDQLQAHLGNAFTIERELGGGGMSRVFVANEVRLSRKVVIKVLSPELVRGLNAERFEREILLAASLQQANIVPVLAAGEVEGLPYFTMPFVEGESLRARLTGGGLPIPDVIAILRDVARALDYAHARGVVHRDIKPDNVLLSGATAVVTDFGIAKALSASRAESGATLTSVGTSIGTPAYMAPEQVAGDPNIDHRVDLYSLGCTAYELLTGRSPFGDRTPQRMLAAHLSETPTAVSVLRRDTPAPLAALVTRLLQKDPAERVQSASEVLGALDMAGTASAPTLALSAPGALPKILGLYLVALGAVAILAKAAVVGIGLPDWVFPGAVGVMLLGLPALLFTAYAKRVARRAATATPTLTPGGSMVGRPPSGTMATIALKASPHVSWKRTARGGVYAMAAFVFLVVAFMVTRALGIGPAASLFASGQLSENDKIVLADFVTAPEDSALAPVVVEAVRSALSQSKSVALLGPVEVSEQLQLMGEDKDARLTDDLAAKLAIRAGAKAVLGGSLASAGSGYVINLQLRSAATGAILASFPGTADGLKGLLSTVDKLTRQLRGKVGESLKQVQRSVPLERATTSDLDALRLYSQAVIANDRDQDYPRAIQLAREAVAKDSTFALAWRKLAIALGNINGSQAATGFGAGTWCTIRRQVAGPREVSSCWVRSTVFIAPWVMRPRHSMPTPPPIGPTRRAPSRRISLPTSSPVGGSGTRRSGTAVGSWHFAMMPPPPGCSANICFPRARSTRRSAWWTRPSQPRPPESSRFRSSRARPRCIGRLAWTTRSRLTSIPLPGRRWPILGASPTALFPSRTGSMAGSAMGSGQTA